MKTPTLVGVVGVVVVGLAAAVLWFLSADDVPAVATSSTEAVSVETEMVTRRTLRQAEEFDATVGYGDKFSLPGQVPGTVTWVPEEGTILEPGDMLYKVDERPTYWTRGDVPMYRTLKRGSKGTDVEQLQRYLQVEGYLSDDAKMDGVFGTALRTAVKAWQDDHGLDDTGRVDATELLFLPHESLRVATAPRIADAPHNGILEVTSPDLFVSAEVSGRKKKAFEGEPTIEVELADGSRYSASVNSIIAVESQDPLGEQRFKVRLDLDAPTGQEPGEVTVEVIDVLAKNVLTVPVRALVALVEDGYAVEVVQTTGASEYRSVEIGEFADGWVEVTGDVAEGDQVVVPA